MNDDEESRRRRIAENVAKALGKMGAVVRVEGGKVLAFKPAGDIWDDLPRRHQLHKRLVAACHSVMTTGDLTEQAVAEALGKRPGATLFDLHAETANLVANAGTLVGLAHERWVGFSNPPERQSAIDEVFAAIQESPGE